MKKYIYFKSTSHEKTKINRSDVNFSTLMSQDQRIIYFLEKLHIFLQHPLIKNTDMTNVNFLTSLSQDQNIIYLLENLHIFQLHFIEKLDIFLLQANKISSLNGRVCNLEGIYFGVNPLLVPFLVWSLFN